VNVSDVMTRDVLCVTVATPFKEAVDLLVSRGVSALPVVDDLGRVIGIVSEADLVPKVAERRHARSVRTCGDAMTTRVVTVRPGDTVPQAASLLLDARVQRAPVVDDTGLLVGIVSRRDLLGAFVRPDAVIGDDVAAALADPMRTPEGNGVRAAVRDGVVTLRGSVDTEADRRVVTGAAFRVPGVVDVVDELLVKGVPIRL
jgi:CBS domain-containing protein